MLWKKIFTVYLALTYIAKLKLMKLQKLRAEEWRKKQNQVLHRRQNQGENKIKESKLGYWFT